MEHESFEDPETAALMNARFAIANDGVYARWADELLDPLEDDERMVVLPPNYPSFLPGWTQAIVVDVDLSALPTGTWFFTVRADVPTKEIGELYTFEYGLRYQPSGFGVILFEGLVVVV
jgi:hypothetical protein